MPPVSILIKPASAACNIRCKYCFYRSVSDKRAKSDMGMMSSDTLEQLVKSAFDYADGYCGFAFQGGEPTLAGLDFYRQLVALQNRYNTRQVKVENTIQTNGLLLDEEWCSFLASNRFLVGLSLDGPRKVHDLYRIKADGSGSFAEIMGVVERFKRHEVEFNVVSVITARAAGSPDHLYRFYKNQDFRYLQFIPCLDEAPGADETYSLRPGQYGKFLCRMFDLWYEDFISGYQIDIRFFSNLVQMAAGYQPEACGMCGHCTPYPVVEGDGSVYPCDFYVNETWRLGTVADGFDKLLTGEKAKQFALPSSGRHQDCQNCEYFALCRGGCRRWREPLADQRLSLNVLCEDYKLFFSHATRRIYEMAKRYLSS